MTKDGIQYWIDIIEGHPEPKESQFDCWECGGHNATYFVGTPIRKDRLYIGIHCSDGCRTHGDLYMTKNIQLSKDLREFVINDLKIKLKELS